MDGTAQIPVCNNSESKDTWFSEYGKVFNLEVY